MSQNKLEIVSAVTFACPGFYEKHGTMRLEPLPVIVQVTRTGDYILYEIQNRFL